MRASWHALHAHLIRSSERLSFQQDFDIIRNRHAELRGLADISALMDHQHQKNGDPARKDRVLRALVGECQGDDPVADTAKELTLLVLWPGLDALYGRLRRYFHGKPDELASELSARMSGAIGLVDLGKVNRLAATLLMNVRRDILRGLKRDWSRLEDALQDDLLDTDAPCWAVHPGNLGDFGTRITINRLRPILGKDAEIVVAVVLMGFSQREAALALGLPYEAARKRYQRAIARLREIAAQNG